MNPSDLREALLSWYDLSRRDLPWRVSPGEVADPYRTWISEVMLQQTRVETVKPYFTRWMQRFPTLVDLAVASEDEVLKQWEGLGYYSRARNLHRAVREVAERYGGMVPDDPATFRGLPGVGRYTAGAVLSIAFGRAEPVVDGNVRRVLARVLDEPEPTPALLWKVAESLATGPRPGDLNQAMMELGATVCTPRAPSCDACPIERSCHSRAAGTVSERPVRKKKPVLPVERLGVAVAIAGEAMLLRQRPRQGLLGGLWEFPSSPIGSEGSPLSAAREVLSANGIVFEGGDELATLTHTFSHFRAVYHAHLFRVIEPPAVAEPLRWANAGEIGGLALPRAQRRLAEAAVRRVQETDRASR
jgi:A/G-specific adenine glycosylase